MSTTESCFSASSVRNHIPLQMVFIIINTHSTLARKLPKISPLKRVSQEWHWSPKKLKNSKREKIFIIKKAKWPSNKVSSFFNDNGNYLYSYFCYTFIDILITTIGCKTKKKPGTQLLRLRIKAEWKEQWLSAKTIPLNGLFKAWKTWKGSTSISFRRCSRICWAGRKKNRCLRQNFHKSRPYSQMRLYIKLVRSYWLSGNSGFCRPIPQLLWWTWTTGSQTKIGTCWVSLWMC